MVGWGRNNDFCLKECNPYDRPVLTGVNTEAAEQGFQAVGQHKATVKHMTRHRFVFFTLRMADLRNRWTLRKAESPQLAVHEARMYQPTGNPRGAGTPTTVLDPQGPPYKRLDLGRLQEGLEGDGIIAGAFVGMPTDTKKQKWALHQVLREWACEQAMVQERPQPEQFRSTVVEQLSRRGPVDKGPTRPLIGF